MRDDAGLCHARVAPPRYVRLRCSAVVSRRRPPEAILHDAFAHGIPAPRDACPAAPQRLTQRLPPRNADGPADDGCWRTLRGAQPAEQLGGVGTRAGAARRHWRVVCTRTSKSRKAPLLPLYALLSIFSGHCFARPALATVRDVNRRSRVVLRWLVNLVVHTVSRFFFSLFFKTCINLVDNIKRPVLPFQFYPSSRSTLTDWLYGYPAGP